MSGVTVAEALARHPGAVTFSFGDSAALNAEILALVRAGAKTVTCDAQAAFAARGEPLPVAGRVDIALDWAGAPQLALRTEAVEVIAFDAMTGDRIAAQGEFADLAAWRRGYEAYLRRSGHFAPDAPMVVETFAVVEDFACPAR
ncbi:ASCH domain-containing protein [Aestuariicoccus sp. MJ-SS9]|uniref:ASCH domain-containing protein n=1 Tax=Aestuariicoccus sp. MJ-SS9 TaxID=3079855 RepID=UPI0029145588|nr:ASCH domain-containing protein [Aestuariicoccus sp. MJ-SS9]MDU8910539.1 ASCH domain-containing protein [Aestuariicoccus sp. MJ-SS9]